MLRLYKTIVVYEYSACCVIMLVTFIVVLTFFPGGEFVDDNIFYSDGIENVAGVGVEESWADEAVLDVAFHLRQHKFNDFDRR